jgi:hypothetical protein
MPSDADAETGTIGDGDANSAVGGSGGDDRDTTQEPIDPATSRAGRLLLYIGVGGGLIVFLSVLILFRKRIFDDDSPGFRSQKSTQDNSQATSPRKIGSFPSSPLRKSRGGAAATTPKAQRQAASMEEEPKDGDDDEDSTNDQLEEVDSIEISLSSNKKRKRQNGHVTIVVSPEKLTKEALPDPMSPSPKRGGDGNYAYFDENDSNGGASNVFVPVLAQVASDDTTIPIQNTSTSSSEARSKDSSEGDDGTTTSRSSLDSMPWVLPPHKEHIKSYDSLKNLADDVSSAGSESQYEHTATHKKKKKSDSPTKKGAGAGTKFFGTGRKRHSPNKATHPHHANLDAIAEESRSDAHNKEDASGSYISSESETTGGGTRTTCRRKTGDFSSSTPDADGQSHSTSTSDDFSSSYGDSLSEDYSSSSGSGAGSSSYAYSQKAGTTVGSDGKYDYSLDSYSDTSTYNTGTISTKTGQSSLTSRGRGGPMARSRAAAAAAHARRDRSKSPSRSRMMPPTKPFL